MHTSAQILLPNPRFVPPYPVMFLLHGLSDDDSVWMRRTSIENYAEDVPLIIVMPNGGRGFYLDAQQGFAFGTAIGVELPNLLRNYFPTRPGWAITGLSMGGYGAMKLGLSHPETFRSVVSHSGVLTFGHDPVYLERPDTAGEWRRILGEQIVGGPADLFPLVLASEPRPRLRFDCGVDDHLIEANRTFHRHLVEHGIEHEYEEFEGGHTWEYWDLHVQEAIAFHRESLGI